MEEALERQGHLNLRYFQCDTDRHTDSSTTDGDDDEVFSSFDADEVFENLEIDFDINDLELGELSTTSSLEIETECNVLKDANSFKSNDTVPKIDRDANSQESSDNYIELETSLQDSTNEVGPKTVIPAPPLVQAPPSISTSQCPGKPISFSKEQARQWRRKRLIQASSALPPINLGTNLGPKPPSEAKPRRLSEKKSDDPLLGGEWIKAKRGEKNVLKYLKIGDENGIEMR